MLRRFKHWAHAASRPGDDVVTRRDFLEFLGRGSATAVLVTSSLTGCKRPKARTPAKSLPFKALEPSRDDTLKLASGFRYDMVLSHAQPLNSQGARFGYNNDYIDAFSIPNAPDDLLLWVNHESVDPMLLHGKTWSEKPTQEEVDQERKEVGGSLARIRRVDGRWQLVENDALNRRLDATTAIPLVGAGPILGKRTAIGTLANCAGGKTPWGTVLTCEENYDNFYGERGEEGPVLSDYPRYWHEYYDQPPEHYGWVVEVHPFSGSAKKLLPLGRFAHECATTRTTGDGRCVVYSGDDQNFGCLFKFIADKVGTLESGTLYVADTENGRWVSLDRDSDPRLQKAFASQTDLLIHARKAAQLVGGTPLDRPEDIEIDPATGSVLIALTNNTKRGNFYGSILRLEEKDNRPEALSFRSTRFLAGGEPSGIACPDNLAFDPAGGLWITNDVKGSDLTTSRYRSFGNNGLFYVPMKGSDAGRAFQVASAPVEAELTGPKFSPDGSTLFLSVQHPGEATPAPNKWSSNWPKGGGSRPAPSVVAISGPSLDALVRSADAA